ncbi:Ribonuclease P protein subunit p30 [Dirofilaria immitis]|nr:Ribonuclease P protein subunit p30 [Dirofilaria immitis]
MSLSFVDDQFQFAEMNIRHTGNMDETMAMVRRAVRMGYDSIVINTDIGQMVQENVSAVSSSLIMNHHVKKKGGKERNIIPNPVSIDCAELDTSMLDTSGKRLRIFSRLTTTISSNTEVHLLMHHPQLKKYDLIAVRPSDDQILQTLSRKGEFVDIITYDQASTSVGWLNKSKIIQLCINDGITFEITYADALKDSSQRREVLTNGRQLLMSTKRGDGVVIASGAERMIDIRAPYDAANISVLFGNAKKTLLRAESRKTLKSGVLVRSKEDLPKNLIVRLNVIEKIMRIPEFRAQLEIENMWKFWDLTEMPFKMVGEEWYGNCRRRWEWMFVGRCCGLIQTLNASQQEKLPGIITEIELLSRCYNYFPEHLSDSDWKRLLQCETQKQRFIYIKFCHQKELKELKYEAKRQLKVSEKLGTSKPTSGFAMFVGTTQRKRIADQRRLMNHLHNLQLDSKPALLIDCRFLNDLSPQALSQTLIQLSYLAKGRDSPHAELDLEEVEGSKAYVLGGIVDRVAQHRLHPHATLLAAEQDGIKVCRLPIDKYIKWKSGSKSMTLLAVTSILYSVYESCGDWEDAFKKYVPVRNIRGPEEKNAYGRRLHAHIHDYEKRLLIELNQRL